MVKNRKILLFFPSSVGGAERMSITIAKCLAKAQFEPKLIIVSNELGEIVNFIPKNLEYSLLKLHTIWDFATIRIIKLLREEEPYAVFSTHMYLNPRVLVAASVVGGIKKIIRNDNYVSTLNPLEFFMCRFTYFLADKVVAQQEEMKEDIVRHLKINKRKIFVVHNPIDIATIEEKVDKIVSPYPHDDSINFLWVSRFDKTKGHDILAKAFQRVFNEEKRAHLYFVGDYSRNKSFYNEIKQMLSESDIEKHVHYVGFDNNPYRWMKYCHCFVLPSRIEGLPNTLIEAQYLGKPCVATRCIPIIDRIISNGINGFVVDSEDVVAMAEAMLKAYKLNDVSMTYQPATYSEINRLFE